VLQLLSFETCQTDGVSIVSVTLCIAYFIIGSPKEGYLSRVGKVKPTLLTFPPIPSGPRGAIW
jgi:hypothetical protein